MTEDPVGRFFSEYTDVRHAVMDWRLGYSVVKRLLGSLGGRVVLHYGCGDGRFSRLLRDRGARVIAVDTSSEAVAAAQAKGADGIFYHVVTDGNLSVMGLRSADLAVSTFALCNIQQRSELTPVARAIHDRLKPGGCYVLAEPHPDSVGRHFYSMTRRALGELHSGTPIEVKMHTGNGRVIQQYHHTRQEYLDLLAETGFVVEHIIEPTMSVYPDEPHWREGRNHPPFIIIRARR